jgi:hypothetical protein
MADLTINEALVWQKTLKARHAELVELRDRNSARERRPFSAHGDKEVVREPTYDVKVLDQMVSRVAREMRLLEQAIKATNGVTKVLGYSQDDSVLGELK